MSNFGSIITGQNPGGILTGAGTTAVKRKLTEHAMPDLAGLADDLYWQCAKEYNRRLSGQNTELNPKSPTSPEEIKPN
jgi:hypothetical protein